MDKLADKLIPILIGILIGMSFGLYAGATITNNHAERYRTESVNNAVSEALEFAQMPPSCTGNEIIEFIKGMDMNGISVTDYTLTVKTNKDVSGK